MGVPQKSLRRMVGAEPSRLRDNSENITRRVPWLRPPPMGGPAPARRTLRAVRAIQPCRQHVHGPCGP